MELRCIAVFLGLCLLAVSQCSEARHSMERRDANDDDIFANDEAIDDEGPQNDDFEEVKDAPMIQAIITTKPTTYEITKGKDVRLECNVDPDNGTVVQWFKNNTLIFIGTIRLDRNERYSTGENDSKDLIIRQVESSDSSVYRCELAQETTDPVQVEHNLIVLESPVITRFTATNDGNIIEGANLLLTCDVRGKPPPQIVWSRTNEEDANRLLGENDGNFSMNSVFMSNIKPEHSGKYYCYAFNSVGNTQAELRISVAAKPRVHVHKTVVNSAINVEAVLQCSAHFEKDDKQHIQWYKDGLLISEFLSEYVVSTNGPQSNLTVTPTSASDFGTFTCEAVNDIGKHNRSVELVQKPVIESLGAKSGKLTWTIHSHLPLQEISAQVRMMSKDGEWKQFNIPLPSEQHHKYDIEYDLRDKINVGKYEAIVKVKNDHSWSDNVDPVVFDIEIDPQLIQPASILGAGSDAYSIRPTSTILSAILMYVLVRLL